MASLSPRSLDVAAAVAEALFDRGARGRVPPERLAFLRAELASYARSIGPQTSLALRAALLVAQLAPLALGPRRARLTSLPPDERGHALEALERSRLGLVVVLLKVTLTMLYFEHPAALAETGYDAQGLRGPAFAPGASPLLPLARPE